MKLLKYYLRKIKKGERGQAMLLIALAFLGLVAFIGLAIDAGILFAHIGHLRRAVDSAALSAANQIRQTTSVADRVASAQQLILLNLPAGSAVDDLSVIVQTCDDIPATLPNCEVNGIKRKLARVQATLEVRLAFLPMVGWYSVPLTADAISEAASIDLVLVIDNSTSMTYDADCTDGDDDDGDGKSSNDCVRPDQYQWPGNEGLSINPNPCPGQATPDDPCMDGALEFDLPDDYYRYPTVCNFFGNCEPFEKVRAAAKTLVNRMYQDYDQIALVTFNKYAGQITPEGSEGTANEAPLHAPDLNLTINKQDAIDALDAMRVYPNIEADDVCENWGSQGDPRGCMRTNTAAGLMMASRVLDPAINSSARQEAVKVVVLLSDGLANAAYDMGSYPWPAPGGPVLAANWLCHPDWWRVPATGLRPDGHIAPFCTDGDPDTGYKGIAGALGINEDSDNLARRYADYLGCLPTAEGGSCAAGGGLGAVIFTIGLGDGVTDYTVEGGTVPSPVVGEELLRYIARVGFNGEPEYTPNSPCWGVGTGASCGNYYYAPSPESLNAIFEEIADRIFTRLTH